MLKTNTPKSHTRRQLLLDVDNVSVTIGSAHIIEAVSFCIHSGEFIGLIGPNGAGKTTLLRAILGLIPTSSGAISHLTSRVGYIPQRGFMHDIQVPINVMEVVMLGANGKRPAATTALHQVGLEAVAQARFRELSGGQQQRVLIAKALASQPELLILDEPTTGIDEQSQVEFYDTLKKLHSTGIAVIMISHNIDTVLKYVSRVICLYRTILYDGPPKNFESKKYMPAFYTKQHQLLHHQHGTDHLGTSHRVASNDGVPHV